jgi:hypothetical protein
MTTTLKAFGGCRSVNESPSTSDRQRKRLAMRSSSSIWTLRQSRRPTDSVRVHRSLSPSVPSVSRVERRIRSSRARPPAMPVVYWKSDELSWDVATGELILTLSLRPGSPTSWRNPNRCGPLHQRHEPKRRPDRRRAGSPAYSQGQHRLGTGGETRFKSRGATRETSLRHISRVCGSNYLTAREAPRS